MPDLTLAGPGQDIFVRRWEKPADPRTDRRKVLWRELGDLNSYAMPPRQVGRIGPPKLDDIRGVFLQKLETILPETRNMTNSDCLALLMGDDPPQKIENLLYRFLTSLFRRRLGILAAQGEGR